MPLVRGVVTTKSDYPQHRQWFADLINLSQLSNVVFRWTKQTTINNNKYVHTTDSTDPTAIICLSSPRENLHQNFDTRRPPVVSCGVHYINLPRILCSCLWRLLSNAFDEGLLFQFLKCVTWFFGKSLHWRWVRC